MVLFGNFFAPFGHGKVAGRGNRPVEHIARVIQKAVISNMVAAQVQYVEIWRLLGDFQNLHIQRTDVFIEFFIGKAVLFNFVHRIENTACTCIRQAWASSVWHSATIFKAAENASGSSRKTAMACAWVSL